MTSLRWEDEKMAVIIQQMVGADHGGRFYPEMSGVARSYNFYPVGPQKPDEGIVSIALGLGKTIVEGGATVRFCPRYPDHLQQFFSPRDALRDNQRDFYALDMSDQRTSVQSIDDERVIAYPLQQAEADGTLQAVASTYSAENDALYDGTSRPGTRIVTFAPILKYNLLPVPQALDFISSLGTWGFGTAVEIEFALNLTLPAHAPKKLGLLQIRPLMLSRETDELTIDDVPDGQLLCKSPQVLGHGVIRDLRDVVVVGIDTFERSKSRDAAAELARINAGFVQSGTGYLLIGPGRWGSLDPLLGIPVKWDQICAARAIVESEFRDMSVDPSQGSHFFQNLTAFQVGYFSVSQRIRGSFMDWDWLSRQQPVECTKFVRHIRLDEPLTVKMNGHTRRGVILKQ